MGSYMVRNSVNRGMKRLANSKVFQSTSPLQTRNLGCALGQLLQPGDTILLSGTLGAGKTQFAKGVAQGVGVVAEVTSPTFTFVAEYDARCPFVHMDLYRLYGQEEPIVAIIDNEIEHIQLSETILDSIGFESYLDGRSIVLIEWPQGVLDWVEDAIFVQLLLPNDIQPDERILSVQASGSNSLARLDEWVTKWQR